jgi:SM-20-related protein
MSDLATSTLLDYPALQAAPISDQPFRHILVRNFVPPAPLARVYADLPRVQRGGSFPPEALSLGPAANALVEALESDSLRQLIGAKLGLVLYDAPTMLTVRVYCRDKDGQIHTDSLAKRVTVLLYLNPEEAAFSQQEGCLRLLRGPDDLEDYAVEVPPTNGTLLVFPNGPTTWHGHKTFVGPRYSMQLNYMTNDSKARNELRRHRLSAFVKRLAPVG